jgi:hypothetical protein
MHSRLSYILSYMGELHPTAYLWPHVRAIKRYNLLDMEFKQEGGKNSYDKRKQQSPGSS